MCWESFDVVVQGQTTMPKLKSASCLLLVLLLVKRGWPSLKVPISSLLLLPEVWDVKLTLNSTFWLPGGRSYHCSGLVFLKIEYLVIRVFGQCPDVHLHIDTF